MIILTSLSGMVLLLDTLYIFLRTLLADIIGTAQDEQIGQGEHYLQTFPLLNKLNNYGFCIRQPSHRSVSLSEFRIMGKKHEEFDCFSWFEHAYKSRVLNSKLDPVLLVPRIFGSILDAVNKKDGSSERVWVRCYLIVT